MSHVSSPDPACVSTWLALDAHKLSLVAGVLPAAGGEPELVQIENTERSVRRLVAKLGGPEGLYCCYEAGPTGYELYRLLSGMGVSLCHRRPLADARAPGRSGQDRPPRCAKAGQALPRFRSAVFPGVADRPPGRLNLLRQRLRT